MKRISMNSVLTFLVLAAAMLVAPAMIPAADIVDGGGFFSAETLAKANQTIRDLEQKTGHQVRIETFASVPSDKLDAVKKMSKTERETYFTTWLHERAKETQARGIVVLICKEPAHLRLWGANAIQKSGFGADQAKIVRELFLSGFKAKEYDKTLTEALAQLSTIFVGLKHAPQAEAIDLEIPINKQAARPAQAAPHAPLQRAPQRAAQGANWSNVIFVVAMVIGGLFLFSAVMRMFGGRRNPGPGGAGGYGGYGGGGGGFMSGLTGGIFGALAGNWLYNQFSDHHASAGEIHSAGNDSSSDNGGFDSGAADAGGTDFGGGDFGGGDFGGGDGGGDF